MQSGEDYNKMQLIVDAGALVDELGDPRLADPGLLSVFEKGPLADGGSNAEYRWMAPELLSDQRAETTFATDVYAFTMTCWEV
ncbi:hypothetical protein M422DRAFT_261793 [Sphaerobolus stellatus SS14]|uniref:Protein kinase domain-containing protein n=1 Tax=Sphaerobolus stellatus (strain SS14) TaxID=990650 RepID=A0A0C9V2I2_SPHS4|nr:hypothetical protein M422DRAFT_261793 [Sphaerobolus stellatus SS14]